MTTTRTNREYNLNLGRFPPQPVMYGGHQQYHAYQRHGAYSNNLLQHSPQQYQGSTRHSTTVHATQNYSSGPVYATQYFNNVPYATVQQNLQQNQGE